MDLLEPLDFQDVCANTQMVFWVVMFQRSGKLTVPEIIFHASFSSAGEEEPHNAKAGIFGNAPQVCWLLTPWSAPTCRRFGQPCAVVLILFA